MSENGYCGPAALAYVAGITVAEAARIIRDVRADGRPVKGVSSIHLVRAFERAGFTLREIPVGPGSGAFEKRSLRRVCTMLGRGRYLVGVRGHWLVVDRAFEGPMITDNKYQRIRTVPRPRRLVRMLWRIEPRMIERRIE